MPSAAWRAIRHLRGSDSRWPDCVCVRNICSHTTQGRRGVRSSPCAQSARPSKKTTVWPSSGMEMLTLYLTPALYTSISHCEAPSSTRQPHLCERATPHVLHHDASNDVLARQAAPTPAAAPAAGQGRQGRCAWQVGRLRHKPKHADDMRVVKPRKHLSLALEALAVLGEALALRGLCVCVCVCVCVCMVQAGWR